MNEAYKIAKVQRQQALETASIGLVRDVLTNPAVMAVLGTIVIEYMQGHDAYVLEGNPILGVHQYQKKRLPGGGFVGSVAGSFAETGLVAYCAAGGTSALKDLGGLAGKIAGLLK